MKIRNIAVLLIVVLLLSLVGPVAAFARASRYIAAFYVRLEPVSNANGKIMVSFWVEGPGIMEKIGADRIVIQEKNGCSLTNAAEYNGSDDPSFYYDTNSMDHDNAFDFYGVPGRQYKAIITAYGKNSQGSGISVGESSVVTCEK